MERLQLSSEKLAERIGIKKGTLANRLAGLSKEGRINLVNEFLKNKGYRCTDIVKEGRRLFFALKPSATVSFPISSVASPSTSQEAGFPRPASTFSPAFTDKDAVELDQLSSDKRKEALGKLKAVKYALTFGVRKASREFKQKPSTVQRWCSTYTTEGVKALVGLREKEYSEAVKSVFELAEAMFCKSEKVTVKDIYSDVKKFANKAGINLSYEQLRNHLNDFHARNKYYVERLRNGESKAQRYAMRAGRVSSRFQPNERWEWDHTRMDNVVVIHDGKEIRPWLSVIRDTATSYILSYLLLPYNPHAGTVARLVIGAFNKYGMPKIIRTDWGRDFNADRIRAGLKELGIHLSNARPYSGWGKGAVEGGFRIIKSRFCRKVPGYSQEDPKQRKGLERIWGKGELITFEEYERLFRKYVENYNIDKAEKYRPFEKKGVDGDFLYWALAERKIRTVTKATIRLENEYYYADELEEYESKKVEVRLDDSNDSYIKVFTLDGKFICDAVAESKRDPEAWRKKLKRRERKTREFQKVVQARLEIHKLKQEEEKSGNKPHYKEMEALLQEPPKEQEPVQEVIPETQEVKEELFVPTDDYELLSHILDKKGKVPEDIWGMYERFKSENPLAKSLYSAEIEEIERLRQEVKNG